MFYTSLSLEALMVKIADTLFLFIAICLSFGCKNWAYQLEASNGYDIDAMKKSKVQLIVMDYSHDGSKDRELTKEEVLQVRLGENEDNPKFVLAYMSIGEAEEGRFYWKNEWVSNRKPTSKAPDFLSASNPDFPDNYKVRYWSDEWQDIILGNPSGNNKSYLDRIIDSEFDGVYLDIIDAFFYFGPEGEGSEFDNEETTANLMVDLVVKIANYARNIRGISSFLIYAQNGAFIIDSASPEKRAEYLHTITGLGIEDTFFNGNLENDNDFNPQEDVIKVIESYKEAKKIILAIDYLTDAGKIDTFYRLAKENGYVPFVSTRALDRFAFPAGYGPVPFNEAVKEIRKGNTR